MLSGIDRAALCGTMKKTLLLSFVLGFIACAAQRNSEVTSLSDASSPPEGKLSSAPAEPVSNIPPLVAENTNHQDAFSAPHKHHRSGHRMAANTRKPFVPENTINNNNNLNNNVDQPKATQETK